MERGWFAQIGVTVSQSSQDVRNDFVKKVYSVLFLQIVSPPDSPPQHLTTS